MTFRSLIGYLILVCNCMYASAQVASHYDIVIDEIFADPTPVIGLPGAEFIELKNISSHQFDLSGFTINNGTSTATIKVHFILKPDSFVVVCSASAAISYSAFGPVIGVTGFPSLSNESGIVSLQSPEEVSIHAVAYGKTWYRNEVKSNGGWTLEMINPKYPCGGYNNWKASTDSKGGTPGQKNAVDGTDSDERAPVLLRTYTPDSMTVIAVFDESVDSSTAALAINYQLDNGVGNPASAFPQPPLFNEVTLKMPLALMPKTVYQLTVNQLTDCAGNTGSIINTAKAGLPLYAEPMDIVINEILFNPKSNGYDYVEIYNRSDKVVDLKALYATNRDINGGLNTVKQITAAPFLFFPGEFIALTENSEWLQANYMVKHPDKIIELPGLPSLPDDQGNIVILNLQGDIVDELQYSHTWHMALITDESGVALERMDYNQRTQTADNWVSAASTAGFGTPTYQNSEFRNILNNKAGITITPKLFSPDNDGNDDYCFINYQVKQQGYIAGIIIYDASGRAVRVLANNATLLLNGSFRWDGLDDKQQKLPVGIYVIVTGIYDLQGKTQQFKNVVTLAGKL